MNYNNESRFNTNRPYPQNNTYNQYNQPNTYASSYNINAPYNNNTQLVDNNYLRAPSNDNNQQHRILFNNQQTPSLNQNNLQLLLKYYPPEQKIKIKMENEKKFNLNPNSELYRFHPRILERIIAKYPSQFPLFVHEQIKKQIDKYKSYKKLNTRIILVIIIYTFALRRRKWFMLTGSLSLRAFMSIMLMMNNLDAGIREEDYLRQTVFSHHQIFQNIITKFNIDVNNSLKIQELFS